MFLLPIIPGRAATVFLNHSKPMTELSPMQVDVADRFTGLLLGTAVGDALGLPAENLSADKIRQRWHGEWKMRFIFGQGMISDDTEHTLMIAQALLSQSQDAGAFQRAFAWKLRWWVIGLPAGVGLATAKSCIKLWLGFPPGKSAVISAGGGPAMRSAIIGAYFSSDPVRRKDFTLASARLTHRSWQAETAALAIAEAAALAMNGQPEISTVLTMLGPLSVEPEWQRLLTQIKTSLAAGHSTADFVQALDWKRGVTGYALHVVPVALYSWLRHPKDFRLAMSDALACGGDADTVGAILGALAGVSGGGQGIPSDWVNAIAEWPRSIGFMKKVAIRLDTLRISGSPAGAVSYFWPGIIPRNLFFIIIVLLHGFRRLAPPWSI